MMTQKLLTKPTPILTHQQKPSHLTLNIPSIDQLFPCFKPGDFAILHGTPTAITPFTTRICVRTQIPKQQGGLASKIIYINNENTYKDLQTTHLSKQYGLDPHKTLKNIITKQTTTAYKLTSLITEKLEKIIKKHNAKIIIITDIAKHFLDEGIPEEETQTIYNQILNYLSSLTKKHQIIIITTYLPHNNTKRNIKLKEATLTKTNINIAFTKTLYTSEIELEKHPTYMLGIADYPTETITLTDYFTDK